MSVICPKCKKVNNSTSVFGKVCCRCGFFIEPNQDNPITKYIEKNKTKNQFLKDQAIKAAKKRLKKEE